MNRRKLVRAIMEVLAGIGILVACSNPSPAATATPLPITPALPLVLLTPTPADTARPETTAEDITPVVTTIQQALQASNAEALSPLLVDQVLIAQGPNGENAQILTRDRAMQWLTARWSGHHAVASVRYIGESEEIELVTENWATAEPLTTGELVIHLHRYDANGQGDPVSGQWKIDTFLYP